MPYNIHAMLQEKGPSTLDQLGIPGSCPSYKDKINGVAKFCPSSRANGSTQNSGWNKVHVYYIDGEHDPSDVISAWIDANSQLLTDVSDFALHMRIAPYGDEWKEASYGILGPFDAMGGGEVDERKKECPFCNEMVSMIPSHLPCDESP